MYFNYSYLAFLVLLLFIPFNQSFGQNQNTPDQENESQSSISAVIDETKATAEAKSKDLNKRIEDLELKFEEAQEFDEQTYNSAIMVIQQGIDNGIRLETVINSSIRLLSAKELIDIAVDLNNPISTSIGKSFTDLVTESAAETLIPKIKDETEDKALKPAKSKFKGLLKELYNGPLFQGLVNSNPITSVVNTAIQLASSFETKREKELSISWSDIKALKSDHNEVLKKVFSIENSLGPGFSKDELELFNNAIEGRIQFYADLQQIGLKQNKRTQDLKLESYGIKQNLQYGISNLVRILNLDIKSPSNSLQTNYRNLSWEESKAILRTANFQEAVTLSGFSSNRLVTVESFYSSIKSAFVEYIEDYIRVLQKHQNTGEKTGIDSQKVAVVIAKLEELKEDFN